MAMLPRLAHTADEELTQHIGCPLPTRLRRRQFVVTILCLALDPNQIANLVELTLNAIKPLSLARCELSIIDVRQPAIACDIAATIGRKSSDRAYFSLLTFISFKFLLSDDLTRLLKRQRSETLNVLQDHEQDPTDC
jgi:hypothetical protein